MTNPLPPIDDELDGLRRRVDALAELCSRLLDDNRRLQNHLDNAQQERSALLNRHDQARSRVEAMINRLKTLEQGP